MIGFINCVLGNLVRKLKRALHVRFFVRKAVPVKEYVKDEGEKMLYSKNKKVVAYSVNYVGEKENPIIKEDLLEQYVCEISDVSVIASSNNILSKSGTILYDLLCSSNENYRITDRGFLRHKGRCVRIGERYVLKCYQYGESMDTAISLVGNFSYNYYHFVYEFITKFFLLSKCQISKEVPLIVDEVVSRTPQMLEILQIFSDGRKIVYLPPKHLCKVKKLYVVSFVNQIIPNFNDVNKIGIADNLYSPDATAFIRNRFMIYAIQNTKSYPKRIFIVRRNNRNRSYNEQELIKIASEYDFAIVSPEELSAQEQFKMFSSVDCIIAASGAALTNIICCQPRCRILVLISRKIELTIFSSIAGCLDVNMRYLPGICSDTSKLQSSYTIDAERFRSSITDWLLKE